MEINLIGIHSSVGNRSRRVVTVVVVVVVISMPIFRCLQLVQFILEPPFATSQVGTVKTLLDGHGPDLSGIRVVLSTIASRERKGHGWVTIIVQVFFRALRNCEQWSTHWVWSLWDYRVSSGKGV